MDDVAHLARGYREFAADGAWRSPLYGELADGVAGDREILAWLSGLPTGKRQPNLLFAAYRLLAGTPAGWAEFRAILSERRAEIEAQILARRTQTNEPARCALMLPILAALPQPLALLEVGASAGLCLLPDRYAYDYDGHLVGDGSPRLRCRPEGPVPLPDRLPNVAWRAGLDLSPIDVTDDAAVRWLELLVWPGEEYRLDDLRAAIAVARADPPRLVQGDLTSDLPALAAEAPRDATLVIFHTAVLAYVPAPGRVAFREAVRALGATWLACEDPRVFGVGVRPRRSGPSGVVQPWMPGAAGDRRRAPARRASSVAPGAADGPHPGAPGFLDGPLTGDGPKLAAGAPPRRPLNMALVRDGRVVAHADGHGVAVRWL